MSVMSLIALSATVFAANPTIPTTSQDINLFTKTEELLTTIQGWATAVIGIIAILVLLYAAFLFMTAGGDETKMESAKAYIKYGIIGIIVAVLAYSALAIVKTTLGI